MHGVATPLELVGLAGVITLQSIAEPSLVPFSSGIVHDVFIIRKCLVALSPRPIWVFLSPIYSWLYAESFVTCLTIRPAKYILVLL